MDGTVYLYALLHVAHILCVYTIACVCPIEYVCPECVPISVLLCDIPAMSQLYMALYICVAGPCVWGPCVYMYTHAGVCALYIGICALVYV